jgi:GMP synthase (glutamine-hydrolysing)
MKPFLFLGTRAEDDVADGEYAAVLGFSGLHEAELHRHRLEAEPLPNIALDDWSGIVLGGGPFNVSDPEDGKSPTQLRVEAELRGLAARVVAADFPFLGACYGTGTLGTLDGGVVDRRFGEPIGPTPVALTDDGIADPLFGVLPREFIAFLGHKEAVSRLPAGAVRLALSATCPVQGFRIGANVYATQFHPELDVPELVRRIVAYEHHGYYDPPEKESLLAAARSGVVTEPPKLLARFVELYAR